MKKVILTVGLFLSILTVVSAQETKTTEQTFLELKAKTEYSSKYCTATNVLSLCNTDNMHDEAVYTISSTWLYGAIAFSSKARTNYIFKEYAKRSSYQQVSALINEFKEFQNDACYKVYLDMNPDLMDVQWLKLQVKDTVMSNLFANR